MYYTVAILWLAEPAEQRGNNGDNLTWILDDEGVLTISGTGAMANWNWKGLPWYANKDKIESVVIEDGVTSIGANAY